MIHETTPHPTQPTTATTEAVTQLVVDAKGLAGRIGRSHRTVMVLAAGEAWRTGRLPAPTYIGVSVRTRSGAGRRWLVATVDAWLDDRNAGTEVQS